MFPETIARPAIEPPTVIVPILPSKPVEEVGTAGSDVLFTMSMPGVVRDPPMEIESMVPGSVSDDWPVKSLPTVMTVFAKWVRSRLRLNSPAHLALRLSAPLSRH